MNAATLAFRGLAAGALAAYLVLYGLRPRVAYPDFMLALYDHPWMLLVIFAGIVYIIQWDIFVGVMMLLAFIALCADMFIFGQPWDRDARASDASSAASEAPVSYLAADAGPAMNYQVPSKEPNYSLFQAPDTRGFQPNDPAPFPFS